MALPEELQKFFKEQMSLANFDLDWEIFANNIGSKKIVIQWAKSNVKSTSKNKLPEGIQKEINALAMDSSLLLDWRIFRFEADNTLLKMTWSKKMNGEAKTRLVVKRKLSKITEEDAFKTEKEKAERDALEEERRKHEDKLNQNEAENQIENQSLTKDPNESFGEEKPECAEVCTENEETRRENIIVPEKSSKKSEKPSDPSSFAIESAKYGWAQCQECQYNGFCDRLPHKAQYMEIIKNDINSIPGDAPCGCNVCVGGAAHNGCIYREILRLKNDYLLFDKRNLCFCSECVPFKYRKVCLREELRLLHKSGKDLYYRLHDNTDDGNETYRGFDCASPDTTLDMSYEDRMLAIEDLRKDIMSLSLK